MKRLRRILCQFLLIWIYVILLVGVFSKESAATTLYWTEGAWGSGELKRAQIGNLGSAETIASSSASFSTLAVDHRGGKVYWTGDSLLHRANLDGSNR
ncbi:MAG: hypothetical protein KAU12_01435, partial [Candidatus Omnitrophica bacterium]|nr:hypothetical protein [Candidatus Omnitrophota bacterium]